jgi:hypothetical protein
LTVHHLTQRWNFRAIDVIPHLQVTRGHDTRQSCTYTRRMYSILGYGILAQSCALSVPVMSFHTPAACRKRYRCQSYNTHRKMFHIMGHTTYTDLERGCGSQ